MNLGQLIEVLKLAPNQPLCFEFPSGRLLPEHFHVTEVGIVTKDFVDCGGVRRSERACVLQTLVGSDHDHRLTTNKFSGILSKGSILGLNDNLSVDVEVQGASIETYRMESAETQAGRLLVKLQNKRTACLAPDRCGMDILPINASPCCGEKSTCC